MALSVRLGDAIETHLASMRGMAQAKSTITNRQSLLLRLLASTGNIYTKNLRPEHVDRLFSENPQWSDSTRIFYVSQLSYFQKWLWSRRMLATDVDLVFGRRQKRPPEREKPRVPSDFFDAFMDGAAAPRDRIIVAMGLYLMARSSELVRIQWKDVDLTPGEESVYYYRFKTKQDDRVPMFEELAEEMRRWRQYVCEAMGVPAPHPDWYVVCQMAPARGKDASGRFVSHVHPREVILRPTKPLLHPLDRVKRALEAVGVDARGTGMHTMRRSGAQALLDSLEARGVANAMSIVKEMLGHRDERTTAIYLSRRASRLKRDGLIRGQRLTVAGGDTGGNVVPLRRG